MAGNVATVTAAIVRPASPVVSGNQSTVDSLPQPGGNRPADGGQKLPPKPPPAPEIDYSRVVRQLDAFVKGGDRSLRFSQDGPTGRTVMTVVNPRTQEVIRQVPGEALLALARNIDRLVGQLLNTEA